MGNSWRQLAPIIACAILERYFAFHCKIRGPPNLWAEKLFSPRFAIEWVLAGEEEVACWECFQRLNRITILSLHYFISTSAAPDSALYTPGNNAPWLTWHPAVQSPDPLNFPIVQCQDPPQWAQSQGHCSGKLVFILKWTRSQSNIFRSWQLEFLIFHFIQSPC